MRYSYFILMCILTLIDFVLLAVSLRHRDKRAVNSFIVMLILSAIAHICYGASLIIPWREAKLFVHELKFFGVAFFSTVFYKMYMDLLEQPRWGSRKYVLLLLIFPTAAALLAVTNNSHHLFRTALWVIDNQYGSFVGVQSGPLFWVYLLYSYLLYIFCIVFVTRVYLKTPKLYRMQISIMIYAAIATLLCNFISISGILFEDFGDATLIIFGMAEIIQFYGLVMYKPVLMIRMARDLAFEEINDSVVVFDYTDKLFDFNGAAARLFDLTPNSTGELNTFLSERLGIPHEAALSPRSRTLEVNGRWYTMSIKRVIDADDVFTATAVIMSDITELKHRERALEDMAYVDPITGIANRHAYMRALSEIGSEDLPVAVLRFSVSGMRLLSSTRGDETGDTVLLRIAALLTEAAGDTGFCASIEGDEFALLLKNTSESAAQEVLDRLANAVDGAVLHGGFAVMRTKMENINIIDKAAVDDLYMQKLLGTAAPAR